MNAPKRWLDEGGAASATPFERDLLRSARDVDPPAGAQAAIFAALVAKIGPGGGGGGGGGGGTGATTATAAGGGATTGLAAATVVSASMSAAPQTAAGLGLAKMALLGLAGIGVVAGGYFGVATMMRSSEAATTPAQTETRADPRTESPRVVAPPPIATAEPRVVDLDDPKAAPTAAPVVVAQSSAPRREPSAQPIANANTPPATSTSEPATDHSSGLTEESEMLMEARATLRSGNAAGALAKLEEMRVKFGGGKLGYEREALTIEALAKSGSRAAASQRAKAFIEAHPESIYAERVRPYADP